MTTQAAVKNQERNTKRRSRSTAKRSASSLRVIPLGGMGEIGKNITAIEYGDDIIVIDCGLKFPEEAMLGIDFVIPDVSYLVERKDKIRGIFITHGHEDHIGGIPLIAPRLDAPLYGSALTLALVENKVAEACRGYEPDCRVVSAGDTVQAGVFTVGFIRVSHSIPDAFAIYVKTPLGTIVHSGDFKLDLTPMGGEGTDLASLSALGRDGVLLLMSDSTNSERDGFTASESSVANTFDDIFRSNKDKRIVVAAFASNLYRAQIVISTAMRFNRKVVLIGRSMISYVELARKLGYLDVPDSVFITPAESDKASPNRVVVLTTGSQGEPFSGLVLMSKGGQKQIHLGERDLVVISATPIPGNEKLVSNTVNRLFACGCDVIYERSRGIHVSGHASREEQKIMLSLIKPKYFLPCHGEYRHLVRHSQLAKEMGISAKNIFILQNGEPLSISAGGGAKVDSPVQSGAVLVDGMMLGEFEGSILRERRELSESGLLAVSAVLNRDHELISRPKVDSRGSVFGLDRENMMPEIEAAVARAVCAVRDGAVDIEGLPTEIRKRIREILGKNFRIYPSIIPLITVLDDGEQLPEYSLDQTSIKKLKVPRTRRRRTKRVSGSDKEG